MLCKFLPDKPTDGRATPGLQPHYFCKCHRSQPFTDICHFEHKPVESRNFVGDLTI